MSLPITRFDGILPKNKPTFTEIMMDTWVIQELDSLEIGDIQLEKRIKQLLSTLNHSLMKASRYPVEHGVRKKPLIIVFQ